MNVIAQLKITILEYIDHSYPGWIRCSFEDINGNVHYLIEKVPVITLEELDESSQYPQAVAISCQVNETNGRTITIDINVPWALNLRRVKPFSM